LEQHALVVENNAAVRNTDESGAAALAVENGEQGFVFDQVCGDAI